MDHKLSVSEEDYDQLMIYAKAERRSVSNQLHFILKDYFKVGAQPIPKPPSSGGPTMSKHPPWEELDSAHRTYWEQHGYTKATYMEQRGKNG